jgi:hypothetical protein
MRKIESHQFFIHTVGDIWSSSCRAGLPDGTWPYAVAEPYTAGRLKAAWWVLTGRAYAFQWPKPGDVEQALGQPAYRPPTASGAQ